MAINKATITGNLTRDPELRQTQGGTSVLTIGVAVNDRRKNQQTGEWEDYPNYIDCTIFGNRATGVAPYLEKGMKVAIEGKLNQSRWQAEDGTNRSKIGIIVDEIEFMAKRDGSQQPMQPMRQPMQQQAQPQQFAPQTVSKPVQQQPMQQFAPQPMQQPMQAAPVQQAMPMMQQAPQQVASIYDEDIPF